MKPDDIKSLNPNLATATGAPGSATETFGRGPDDDPMGLIAEAHTRVLDTLDGLDKLAEKSEPGFKPVALEFLTLHSKHETQLAAYLRQHGRNPQEDGSLFGQVNRVLIELHSWFEDVGDNVMDRVKEGEKHVLQAYEAARNAGQTVEGNAMLSHHMEEIEALLKKHVA